MAKLVQVFHPSVLFSLLVASQEMEMGVLQEMLKRTGWSLREEAKLLLAFDECPNLDYIFSHEYYHMEL